MISGRKEQTKGHKTLDDNGKDFVGEFKARLWYGKFKFNFTQQWMCTKSIKIPVITQHVAHCLVTQLLQNTDNFMFRGFAQNAYNRFFRENSRRVRLCSRLADSGNELCRKSRRCLDIVAQETIILNVNGNSSLHLNLIHHPM